MLPLGSCIHFSLSPTLSPLFRAPLWDIATDSRLILGLPGSISKPLLNGNRSDMFKYKINHIIPLLKIPQWLPISPLMKTQILHTEFSRLSIIQYCLHSSLPGALTLSLQPQLFSGSSGSPDQSRSSVRSSQGTLHFSS